MKLIALLLPALLAACGGGGAEQETSDNGANRDLNGELTGRLVTTVDFQPYEFDLSTGAARKLPVVTSKQFMDNRGEGDNVREYNFFAASESPEDPGYVETNYQCFTVPTGACLAIYDANYQVVARVAAHEKTLDEPAKLSRSGKLVAMSDMHLYYNQTATILLMDVASSNVIDSVQIDHEVEGRANLPGHPPLEWGLDDEVIFSVPADTRPTVYVTEPGTMKIARRTKLPASYIGYIDSLDLHPDGKQLLIGYRRKSGANNGIDGGGLIIVLSLDDLSIRIPAVNQADQSTMPIGNGFISQYSNPMWSPDGRTIMFLNNTDLNGSVSSRNPIFGLPAITFGMVVVPQEASRLIVNSPGEPIIAPARAVRMESVLTPGTTTSQWFGDRYEGGYVNWIR